ncbi:hypothetical protein P692DRAFT_201810278 [Suillus brevipes Sb2]|nr:hypothetical protein P692DRAFT_201810278 [Suillus brevipes Sb2]
MSQCCTFCGKEFPTREGIKRHITNRPKCRSAWLLTIEEKASRRVTVDDVADEGEVVKGGGRYFKQRSDAGWTLREGETDFERYRKYKEGMGEDEWAPSCDEEEWILLRLLCRGVARFNLPLPHSSLLYQLRTVHPPLNKHQFRITKHPVLTASDVTDERKPSTISTFPPDGHKLASCATELGPQDSRLRNLLENCVSPLLHYIASTHRLKQTLSDIIPPV